MEYVYHLQMRIMIHVAVDKNIELMNCPEFINKNLDENKNFIVENRSCWNYLSKSRFVQNFNSHFRCKRDNYGQLHHTLLHETSPNPLSAIEQATINSHSVKSHTFLQIIPVTISNGSRTVTTNAFVDSGSDLTLIIKGLAEKLNLDGASKTLKICNVLNSEMSYKSNLVNFFISSKQYPKVIPITNSWTVSGTDLPINKLPIAQIKEKWDHPGDIELSELSSSCEVGFLTVADMPQLHLQHDIRVGNFDAPLAVKTTLGCVLIGGKHSSSVNTKIVSTNKLNINSMMTLTSK